VCPKLPAISDGKGDAAKHELWRYLTMVGNKEGMRSGNKEEDGAESLEGHEVCNPINLLNPLKAAVGRYVIDDQHASDLITVDLITSPTSTSAACSACSLRGRSPSSNRRT
jgi:hypothetical protein